MADSRQQIASSRQPNADAKGQSAVGGERWAVGRYLRLPFLALLVYLCLAIVTTHPLWLHLADAVPGDIGDPLLNTWILAWDSHALLDEPLHLFDANIFYPLPNTLAYSEHLLSTAALAMPLGLISGEPVVAYNLSLLLSFPLAGLGMYLLVLHWTHRREAAFLAGLAFAFAPYRLAAIAHLQLLTVQWLPFSLLALDRLLNQGVRSKEYEVAHTCPIATTGHLAAGAGRSPSGRSRRRGAESGERAARDRQHRIGSQVSSFVLRPSSFVIFTTLQILASWYLAIFTALVLALYTLGWLAAGWRRGAAGLARLAWRSLAELAGSALVVASVALLFALPYLDVLPQLRAARPASQAVSFATHATDFFAAAPFLRISGPLTQKLAERPGFTEENTLFLGVIVSVLALVGLTTARPRWRTVVLAAILATSMALTFAGPYRALTRLLPALTVVRVPPRWIIPATFALAALAGYGVARIMGSGSQELKNSRTQEEGSHDSREFPIPDSLAFGGRALWPVLLVVVSLMMIAESFSAPLPLAPVGTTADLPPIYHALREEALQQPSGWAVVELPMHVAPAPEFPETKRLYASTLGWWGLVNGYSGFTPERQVTLDQALANFPGNEALTALRALGANGVRYLIVHPGEAPLDRTGWEAEDRWQVERQTTLLPVGRFGPDDLYLINPYGDSLITNPNVVTDTYWSAYAPVPVDVRFTSPVLNTEIRLLAYLLQPGGQMLEDWKAGRLEGWKSALFPIFQPSNLPTETRLTLYWQASTSLDTSYTVFVHRLNTDGELVGQADGPPVANHYPTTAWRPGEIVQDSRPVLTSDRYLIGLYDPATGERLPAFAADGVRLPDDGLVVVNRR